MSAPIADADRLAALLALAYATPPASERVIADVAQAIADARAQPAIAMRSRLFVSERDAQIYIARANGSTYREIGAAHGIGSARARQVDLIVRAKIERQWESFQRSYLPLGDRLPLRRWEWRP